MTEKSCTLRLNSQCGNVHSMAAISVISVNNQSRRLAGQREPRLIKTYNGCGLFRGCLQLPMQNLTTYGVYYTGPKPPRSLRAPIFAAKDPSYRHDREGTQLSLKGKKLRVLNRKGNNAPTNSFSC